MENLVRGTKVLVVNPENPAPDSLALAAEAIRNGDLVAFPTETVYGLGANALNADAVAKIFRAKGRPADNPLIVHVADRETVQEVAATVPEKAELLMQCFWPGPLTLVLPRGNAVPDNVSCGLSTVGVRIPDHPVAQALIRAAGVPVAAPSANLSGRPSPTNAEHVIEDLAGRVQIIVDGGETGVGLESTVLDLCADPPVLLRPGGVTAEELREVIGEVVVDPAVAAAEQVEAPRSPGMKYTHYAPKAKMVVVEGPMTEMQAKIRDLAYEYEEEGKRVGIMCSIESRGVYAASAVLEYGSRENLRSIASNLFSALRAFDRYEVDVILAEGVPATGIGLALMNRLRRAAGGRVVSV